jgi:hypothetical protein
VYFRFGGNGTSGVPLTGFSHTTAGGLASPD